MIHPLLPALAMVIAAPTAPMKVDAAQLFQLAVRAEEAGRAEDAQVMYRALARDPNDQIATEARFRHAKMLIRLGKKSEAATLLREVLDRHPEAAPARLELAALLASMGEDERARAELRALRAGALPPEVATFVDRFSAALRARKPVGGTVKFGFLADSNVNRATRSDTLGTVIGDFSLSEDAKASSGRGLSGEGQAYVRIPVGQQMLVATALGSANVYRNSDFNDVSFGARVGPELALNKLRLTLTGGVSRRWFGGEPLADTMTFQADAVRPIDPQTQGRVALSASHVSYRLNDLQDGWNYALANQIEHAFTPSTGGGFSASIIRQELADPAYSAWSGQAALFAWHQMGRATVTASAAVGRYVADKRFILYPAKREEWSRRFSIGITARQLSLLGFAPTAQVTREANRSPVEIYDYRRTAFEVGVTRAF